ncbi:MAG: hypothetical protein K0R17_2018 [Rariglobus sp.]|jgi:hypothetical protein|nr:hypothetical protein [Rariglobus sp.]
MKTAVLLCMGLMAIASMPAREVILLGAQDVRDPVPQFAVTAGGVLTFEVLIPASLDRSMIAVGLWQISGSLTLPLGDPVAVTEPSDVHGITPVRLEFPELERKTRVLVKFTTKDEPRTILGLAQVQVHPPLDWTPIARKVKKEGPRLLVFGRNATLLDFLKAREIECADNGENPPGQLDRDTLTLGSISTKDWEERKDRISTDGGSLLVFVSDSDALPGVHRSPAGEGAITKITLPVLAMLANDPRGEDLLFQLIEQHLHSAPAANP